MIRVVVRGYGGGFIGGGYIGGGIYVEKEKVFGEEGDYLKGMRRLVGEESVVMKEKLE